MDEQQLKGRRGRRRDVEILASRLLSSEILHGRNIASAKEIRNWYNDFKLDTCRRAAAVLLSTLLEYYRRGKPQRTVYDYTFNLILDSKFEMGWKNLFPKSKVSCEKIIKDPWSLLTISDMLCTKKKHKEEGEEYVAYYRAILLSLSEEGGQASYQLLCHSPPPLLVNDIKCKRPRIVSVQLLRDETTRLYKLAMGMVNVIEAQGQI
uniref:Wsv419-like protein n=1 Tax=Metopaulias depressus WSSV-like virus TaxID=1675544 RepID=A0A0K0VL98_9VIRU|nr:wsv419-like protein [Metopaulias depressus WSSV-like virus]